MVGAASVGARCVILGGGGHAAVVIDALLAAQAVHLYAVLDRDPRLWGKDLLGVSIRGGDALIPELIREGVTCFVVGQGGVRDNGPRERLFRMGVASGLTPITVRHPSAVCSSWAEVGAGSALLAGTVINARAVLGVNVILNTGAVVEHDCVVGNHVHVATGAKMGGSVRIGDGAHVGAGATIRESLRIGDGAVIGAGAVVVKDVAPRSIVVGVPAQPLPVRVGP
jgi:UDP-perosamine 4-acetyltransferase